MADYINTIDALGDEAVMDSIINKTITEYVDNSCTVVGKYAFYKCTALEKVILPNVKSIETYAFDSCSALKNVDLPNVTSIGCQGISNTAIETLRLPSIVTLGDNALVWNTYSLKTLDLPKATHFSRNCLYACYGLTTLILRNTEEVCSVHDINGGLSNSNLCVYVPAILIDQYKNSTNWCDIPGEFRALEDYTVDGTTTGELDETKI